MELQKHFIPYEINLSMLMSIFLHVCETWTLTVGVGMESSLGDETLP